MSKRRRRTPSAERLRESLARQPYGGVGPIACSFGVCEYLPGEAGDDFFRRVDRALYQAKSQGRNCVATGAGVES